MEKMKTRRIKKKNLDQGVYDRIIEKIINVEFSPGQQLDINDLAEEFGVSRTPVVQAIKMLNLDSIPQSRQLLTSFGTRN
mgnify:CR=1 FL=1